MRYFSREDLVEFGYPKRHYVGQLAFAFYENIKLVTVLTNFEKRLAEQRSKDGTPTSQKLSDKSGSRTGSF